MKAHSGNIYLILVFIFLIITGNSETIQAQDKGAEFLAIAKDNLREGDRFSALVTLDSALLKSPRYADAYLLRATVRTEIQNLEGAMEDLSTVIRIDPGRAEAYFRRAIIYADLGYHRDYSLRDLSEAIALDRKQSRYYVERARIRASSINTYNGNREYDLAVDDINRAIAVDPRNGRLYFLRAGYKLKLEERDQALQDYSSAIELFPDNAKYYSDRGLLYLVLENYEKSALDYRKAISLDPENPEYYRNLAHAFYNYGNFRASINAFSESINLLIRKINENTSKEQLQKITDELKEVYLMRGSAFANMGREGEACDDFGRSRELGERRALNYMRKYCGK
jgi:tetratricopeptide (TPR) repeat protein